ncbi:hypothetical protein K438DRAFT_1174857 [Mycena galopus ATCC 62051]|nr:hypothetical protein K438DRAFT_1174857 [Mycena galopus ATCC 62051]
MTQNFFTSNAKSHSPRSNLPRGKACMNCRRRKIKCDGRKPICSQCARSPGTADDCEYPLEGRSRTQHLEETIKKLQGRIGELESTANESAIMLHEPYDGGDPTYMALEMEIPQYVDSWAPPHSADVSTSPSSRVNTPSSASSSSTLVLEEPPAHLTEQLVDAFLDNFLHVGFFLDPASFRQSALLAFPFGHYERPSPALLSAVYMWGSRLSQTPRHPVYNEDAFLVCTLQNIHQDLGGNHPHRVMHGIQAEILLSLYYLSEGRPVEGIYHSSAAVSLAISANLHLIKSQSAQTLSQPCFGVLETPFSPPAHAREEGERINAWWTTVVVNNYWRAAHGSPSAIPYQDTPIDTPWPRDLDDYASPQSYPSPSTTPMPTFQFFNVDGIGAGGGGGTVSKFLAGLDMEGFSSLALLAKASILLERAITFSTRYSDQADAAAFNSLDALLEQFMQSLPLGIELRAVEISPNRSLSEMSSRSSFLVTQTLTHAAIIRLHAARIHTSNVSRGKYLAAARAVANIINTNSIELSSWPHVDPILGILWTTASEVFIGELSRMQSFGVVGRLTPQHQDFTSCLQSILSAMRSFASSSPLIGMLALREEQLAVALTRAPAPLEYFFNRVEGAYGAILAQSSSSSPEGDLALPAY